MLRTFTMPPSNRLSRVIESYYVLQNTGSLNLISNPYQNHPQGAIDLMFAVRGGMCFTTPRKGITSLRGLFVIGQQEAQFSVAFHPDSYIVGVVLKPESFEKLLNLPLPELSNTGTSLSGHVSSDYSDVFEKLTEASDESQLADLLNRFFEAQLASSKATFSPLDHLLEHLRYHPRNLSLDALSKEANLSPRSLQRHLKQKVGISPKSYLNVLRFKQAVALLRQGKGLDWQDILYLCGYYDQAHFIKEFKRYTGSTPRRFLKTTQPLAEFFIGLPGAATA